MGARGLDWSGSGYEPMVGCCEHGNEPSGSIKSACVSPNRTEWNYIYCRTVKPWHSESKERLCEVPALCNVLRNFRHVRAHINIKQFAFVMGYFAFQFRPIFSGQKVPADVWFLFEPVSVSTQVAVAKGKLNWHGPLHLVGVGNA